MRSGGERRAGTPLRSPDLMPVLFYRCEMRPLLITPLTPEYAPQAARLHIAGQPGTFLTALGPDVLTVVYRALPQSAGGFGFAAVDFTATHSAGMRSGEAVPFASTDLIPPDLTTSGRMPLQGYISATPGIGGLFVEMVTGRLGELLPPLLRRYAQSPGLALRSVQTALYPLFVREEGEEPAAELLSIMVEPAARSHGIGALLMAAFLGECRSRGLHAATVTVDAANDGAQRFYARHGFTPWRTITLYGRRMQVLRRAV